MNSLVGMVAAGILAFAPAYAQSADSGQQRDRSSSANRESGASAKKSSADNTFVTKAAIGGMAEVKLGTLAKEKASNADVKAFGQQMVDDHSKANDELKQLASSKGITLPTDLDAKNQAEYDRLSKLSGAEFDRMYMQHMVSDHKEDVSEFRRESQRGSDPDVKAWAGKTLPTLE